MGSKTVKVPNVKNYHYTTAGDLLRAQGLEVEYQYQPNDEVEEELVFDTEPSAMEEVQPGSTILVYVSKGSEVEDIEMLDFVGQNIQDAKVQCGVWGLTVKTKNRIPAKKKEQFLSRASRRVRRFLRILQLRLL